MKLNDMEIPKAASQFLQLEEGVVKVRILSDFIEGYSDFDESTKKSATYRVGECPEKAKNPKWFAYFWACSIWNYELEKIQTRQIKSKVAMAKMKALSQDEDRGEITSYDLKVSKTGEGKETKYDVIPANKGPLTPEMTQAYLDANPKLDRMFEGKYPIEK